MQSNNDFKLRWEILKLKGRLIYVKYLKVAIWAVIEIIAELYNSKHSRR